MGKSKATKIFQDHRTSMKVCETVLRCSENGQRRYGLGD